MDTSETYIKMCEKAQEIQSIRPDDDSTLDRNWWVDFVWLPRQDQLQEMLAEHYNIPILSIEWVTKVADLLNREDIPVGQSSMEQLWLAFVMFECYHKKWDGTNWIAKG